MFGNFIKKIYICIPIIMANTMNSSFRAFFSTSGKVGKTIGRATVSSRTQLNASDIEHHSYTRPFNTWS